MSPERRWLPLLPCLLVALVVALVFASALGFELLDYDDNLLLSENTLIHYPFLANLQRIWSGPLFGDYQPLSLTTYFLEWRLVGPNPALYHATNVALHALSAALVARVLRPTLGAGRAGAAALLFAVHPLVVEPVAWVASRKDVLALCLLLATILAARRALGDAQRIRWGWAGACLGLGLAAVLSKSVAVMLPALVLWDRAVVPGVGLCAPPRREVPLLAALCLPAALGVALKIAAWEQVGAASPLAPEGLLGRVNLTAVTYGTYLGHALWPANLHLAYDPASLPAWQQALSWAAFLGAPLALWRLRRRPAALLGLGWWLIALTPGAQIFPFHIWSADRYAYPALPGLAALAVALTLPARGPRGGTRRLAFALVLAALTAVTLSQLTLWKDTRTLWTEHVARDPTNRVAVPSLAGLLLREGHAREARALLEQHLELQPDNHRAGRLLAATLASAGETQRADALFAKHGPCAEQVASMLRRGRSGEARDVLRSALQERPNAPELLRLKGELDLLDGRPASARVALERAARADPTRPQTWVLLARARGRDGSPSGGLLALRRAHEVGLPEVVSAVETARLFVLSGELDRARSSLGLALDREPAIAGLLSEDPELGPLLSAERRQR